MSSDFWIGVSVGGAIVFLVEGLLMFLYRDRCESGALRRRPYPIDRMTSGEGEPFVCDCCKREFPDKNWNKPCRHFGEV